MTAALIRRILSLFLKIAIICAALLMILIVLILPGFLPFKGWISFVFVVIPLWLFVFWVVSRIVSGKFDRKKAPVSFYTVVSAGSIFLLAFIAILMIIFLNKISLNELLWNAQFSLESVHKIQYLESPYKRSPQPFYTPLQRRQLLKTYLGLQLRKILHIPIHSQDFKILNYDVRGYSPEETEFIFEEIFIQQEYYFKTVSDTPVIIDCGSHIGMSILYFKTMYPRARILGFEPAPDTFKFLKENVKRNRLRDVIVLNKAVSNEEGTIKFYGDASLKSSMFEQEGKKEIVVEATRLSQFIDKKVDFLKIDVEGAEFLVLSDLAAANKLGLVQQMIIEYHHHQEKKEEVDELSRFLKILEDHDFGYMIEGITAPPFRRSGYEDVLIFAYKK